MSKYTALANAIRLMEAIEHIDLQKDRETLQEIARDVRYGGAWDGDYEAVAEAMETCQMCKCYECIYKGKPSCKAILKRDGALAIRQLMKDKKEMEKAGNEHIHNLLTEIGRQEDEISRLTEENEDLKEQIICMAEDGGPAEDGPMDPGDGFPAGNGGRVDKFPF